MIAEEIKNVYVDHVEMGQNICLMNQEIEGVRVSLRGQPKRSSYVVPQPEDCIVVTILCSGSITVDGVSNITTPGVYISEPTKKTTVVCNEDSIILTLDRHINSEERKGLLGQEGELPYSIAFAQAPKYTEDCKSPKTTSRMIVPARIVPRFAMGSVETEGDDLIQKHKHPMLDQLFFGLSDNNCSILIDDSAFSFGGNHLVHIPLGSDHGVKSEGIQKVNYLWLDFLFDEESLKYMDAEHTLVK